MSAIQAIIQLRFRFSLIFFFLLHLGADAQTIQAFAEQVRLKYKIPELAFAVISSDSIYEMQTLGVQRVDTDFKAGLSDRFHIGSNTKAITAFIAALLVRQQLLGWDTKFLDLFPELKTDSKSVYLTITLENLLTFRGKLPSYTYNFEHPTTLEITGSSSEQRLKLAKYFLAKNEMQSENGLTPSNVDYILAGLMLERITNKSFKYLVTDLGKTLGIDFGFDYPNLSDTLQPWGHDIDLHSLPPAENVKLNWLLSAGNINVSLPDWKFRDT